MRLAASAAAICLVLSSMGCGTETASDSSNLRECSDVWKEGAKLPKDYAGCTELGQVVAPELLDCNTDGALWTMYDNRLAAVLGDEIFVIPEDEGDESVSIMLSC